MTRTRQDLGDHAAVVIFPPLLFLSCLAAALLLHWWWPLPTGLPRLVRTTLGAVAVVAAAVFGVGGERALHRAGTNVRPDRPTTAIVTTGVYRVTRNPLYLAVLLLFAAVTLFADTAWPLVLWVVLVPVLVKGIVEREERYLERKFGEPYRVYKARVRRWL